MSVLWDFIVLFICCFGGENSGFVYAISLAVWFEEKVNILSISMLWLFVSFSTKTLLELVFSIPWWNLFMLTHTSFVK